MSKLCSLQRNSARYDKLPYRMSISVSIPPISGRHDSAPLVMHKLNEFSPYITLYTWNDFNSTTTEDKIRKMIKFLSSYESFIRIYWTYTYNTRINFELTNTQSVHSSWEWNINRKEVNIFQIPMSLIVSILWVAGLVYRDMKLGA